MKRGYVDTEVGQVHYREAGEGSPLLLLHHTASSSDMYARIQPLLAASHRVIAMDTPGFGMSDAPDGPPSGIDHYTKAAVGLLAGLGIERAHVVAVRTGASIAVDFVSSHPELVDKLVLTGLVAFDSPEAMDAAIAEPSRETQPWPVDGKGDFLDDLKSWIRHFAREDDGEQYLREVTAVLQAGPNFWWAYEAVVRFDAWNRLPELAPPTLFVNPLGDPGFEDAKVFHPRVPGSAYVEIPGIPHMEPGWAWSPAAYPQEYAQAVLDFLGA